MTKPDYLCIMFSVAQFRVTPRIELMRGKFPFNDRRNYDNEKDIIMKKRKKNKLKARKKKAQQDSSYISVKWRLSKPSKRLWWALIVLLQIGLGVFVPLA